MKQHIMLIDSHAIAHAVKYANLGLHRNGTETGIIYGFLKKIVNFASILKPDNVIFAWDGPKSLRRELDPEYKIDRVKKRKAEEKELHKIAMPQFNKLREEIIPSFGFENSFQVPGYEADDIIAYICRKISGNGKHNSIRLDNDIRVSIVSHDSDLYQLLKNSVSLFNIRSCEFYTSSDFRIEYDIEPIHWALVKALCCIEGVGIKGAIDYLNGKLKETTKKFQAIEDGLEEAHKALDLTYLPFDGFPDLEIKEFCGLNLDAIDSFLAEYGYHDMSSDEFSAVFKPPF